MCAAGGFATAVGRAGRAARALVVVAAAAALAIPAAASARLAALRASDDTLARAAPWLAAQPVSPVLPCPLNPTDSSHYLTPLVSAQSAPLTNSTPTHNMICLTSIIHTTTHHTQHIQ